MSLTWDASLGMHSMTSIKCVLCLFVISLSTDSLPLPKLYVFPIYAQRPLNRLNAHVSKHSVKDVRLGGGNHSHRLFLAHTWVPQSATRYWDAVNENRLLSWYETNESDICILWIIMARLIGAFNLSYALFSAILLARQRLNSLIFSMMAALNISHLILTFAPHVSIISAILVTHN